MDSNSDEQSYEEKQLLDVAATWKHNRSLYPGWVVLPPQNRRNLWEKTKDWIPHVEKHHDELKLGDQVWVFEELIWRLQRCLRPISSVLENESSAVFQEAQESDWIEGASRKALRRWIRIGLALIQTHRWRGEYGKLNATVRVLKSHVEPFPDLKAQLQYELALHDLGQGDKAAVTDRVETWDVPESLPFWKIKRAGLLIELGNSREALNEIDEALVRIRRSNGGKNPSYGALSKEGFALLIRDLTRRANQEANSSSVDRWTELANYRADVRTQVEDLMEQVQSGSPGLPDESYVFEDPLTGLYSGRFSFGGDGVHEAIRPGYDLASYFEIGGISLLYHSPQLGGISGTLPELKSLPKWLRGAYPWYTLSLLIRMNKPSDAVDVLGYHLAFGPSERSEGGWNELYRRAQSRAETCLRNLEDLYGRYENPTHKYIKRYEANLGLLSLLVPFLSNEVIEESLKLTIQVYLNEKNGRLRMEMRHLFRNLLKWISRSSLERHLLDLLQFPENNFLTRRCDPFQVSTLHPLRSVSSRSEVEDTDRKHKYDRGSLNGRIEELIRGLDYFLDPLDSDSGRRDTDWYSVERILWRLLRLRQADCLNGEQIDQVVDQVWKDEFTVQRLLSETGLEIDQLLNFPDTSTDGDAYNERIISIVRGVIKGLNHRGKFYGNVDGPNDKQVQAVINTTKPRDPVERRSMNAEDRLWIPWTPEELEPILEWMQGKLESIDGHRLGPITQIDLLDQIPFGTDSDEALKRLSKFVVRTGIPAIQSDESTTEEPSTVFEDRLVELVETMVERGLPARSAVASLYRIGRKDEDTIRDWVNEGLWHQEYTVQIDSAEAVYRFCVSQEGDPEDKAKLLEALIRNVLSLATRGQGALEGVLRWLQRCIRDAPQAVKARPYSDLGTVLLYVKERKHPPDERERIEAQNDKVRDQLSRWIQQRVQSIQLGIWLSRVMVENENGTVIKVDGTDEPIDISELTRKLAEIHPHPQVLRTFNETVEEAGLQDTFETKSAPQRSTST